MQSTERQRATLHRILRDIESINPNSPVPWVKDILKDHPDWPNTAAARMADVISSDDGNLASIIIGTYRERGLVATVKKLVFGMI